MTAMFDNFSFDSAGRHPSQPPTAYPTVSPTSTPDPYTAQHRAMADLTHRFDASRLADRDPSASYFTLDNPSSSAAAAPRDRASPPSPASPSDDPFPSPLSTYLSSDCRSVRARRQAAARLQCSPRHLREISALVARMVREGDQCGALSPATSAASSAADPAERSDGGGGERSGEEGAARSRTSRHRRSFDLGNLDGCVARNVRVSKRRGKIGSAQKS